MAIFTGAGVAIVTPFTKDNKINYDKLAELIEFQIANETDSIIICGTTGESSTLSHEEHCEAIEYCVKKVAPKLSPAPTVETTGTDSDGQ